MTSQFRTPSGRYWDWSKIVETLLMRPNSWAVRLNDQPARLVRTVNDRSHPKLHLQSGRIEAALLHPYTTNMGRRRGDVYLRFIPYTSIIDNEKVSDVPSTTPEPL